ncbi:MAG: hypothetical protein L6Q47_02240 [Ignavibacteriaceae bacterium]|nr:hypothetical protein [Ignavibacteriaceae bacterium]
MNEVNTVKSFEPIIRKYVNTYFEILTPAEREDLVRRYMAMIYHESRGNNAAKGDNGRSFGLGQIYLPTFTEVNGKYFNGRYKHSDILGKTPAAEDLNIHFGILVLKEKFKAYAYGLKDWTSKLNMITKRYNGAGQKAEDYLKTVQAIEKKYFAPGAGGIPIMAGNSAIMIFLLSGIALSFFFRR